MPDIDFSKGYKGDAIEETFKDFTTKNIPFWWQFREVLRASDRRADHWKKEDGSDLGDDEQRELVALSMLNYHFYVGVAEAIASFNQMLESLNSENMLPNIRLLDVRRLWKSTYSSLYTSYNALCNIVCIVIGHKSPFGRNPQFIWNYTPKNAIDLTSGRGLKGIKDSLLSCKNVLEIREHLDHYWVIWSHIDKGVFLIDENFSKGYVPLDLDQDIDIRIDATNKADTDIVEICKDSNLIYEQLSISGGFLDQYLAHRHWVVVYEGWETHDGKRPMP